MCVCAPLSEARSGTEQRQQEQQEEQELQEQEQEEQEQRQQRQASSSAAPEKATAVAPQGGGKARPTF